EPRRLLHLFWRTNLAPLPHPVHLVAQSPVAHAIGLGVSVLAAQIRPGGVAGAVAVLDPRLGLIHRAGAHVHADERLGSEHAAILDELVGAEAVRLLRVPRQLAAPRTPVPGPDAVEPVIAADEVAARPSQDGNAQRPRRVQHVAPKTARVGERRALVVDAAVNATADMLDELTEDAAVHRSEASPEVDRNARHARSLQYSPPCWSGLSVPTTPRRSA